MKTYYYEKLAYIIESYQKGTITRAEALDKIDLAYADARKAVVDLGVELYGHSNSDALNTLLAAVTDRAVSAMRKVAELEE